MSMSDEDVNQIISTLVAKNAETPDTVFTNKLHEDKYKDARVRAPHVNRAKICGVWIIIIAAIAISLTIGIAFIKYVYVVAQDQATLGDFLKTVAGYFAGAITAVAFKALFKNHDESK